MKIFKSIALWLIVLLVVAVVLVRFEGDMLWKIQQYNLFLYSPLFFKQMMVVPGGMLSYLGACAAGGCCCYGSPSVRSASPTNGALFR